MVKAFLKYLLAVVGAAYFGLLVLVLVTTLFRLWFGPTMEDILSCVMSVLGSAGMLFFLAMKYGYDDGTPEKPLLSPRTIALMAAAVGAYALLTVLFRYYTGAATNVAVLARQLGGVSRTMDIQRMAAEHGGWMLLSLVIQIIPFLPAMMAGYAVGGKKRRQSRAALHGERA